ncbi:helix-turn-helix transcriptional regulator [Sphingobacterium daejeonense]|uniref:helix-turn-helix transcriptional regulator n=1 Tax=Sphingobacterium daejeonense TaxID=371142 RepID=UPI0010C3E549|nr:helix-turn-helix transcriptional regulator [Sphingobacterium daejeonense]VTP91605.1 transcriptional activator RhaS [Sphingobacterium daejeonense]
MKAPYTLYTNQEGVKPNTYPENLAKQCRYPLPFAQKRYHYKLREVELVSQQSSYNPFFIDLVEIDVDASTYIPFTIHDKQIYMYFMLKGSLLYMNAAKKPIIKTYPNTFLMSYYDKSEYFAYAEEGEHIALVLSIDPEWIGSIHQEYRNIQRILNRFISGKRPYETMNQCRMDRKVQRWLFQIYSYSQDNKGALDGNLRKYVSLLLEYYDSMLEDQESDIAFKVKTFLDGNYCDVRLNVKYLADHFHMTGRTLLNIFKKQYHVSIQQYYTDLRMEKASSLLDQEGVTIKDIYMEVGYTDERTFRYALERYRKRNK